MTKSTTFSNKFVGKEVDDYFNFCVFAWCTDNLKIQQRWMPIKLPHHNIYPALVCPESDMQSALPDKIPNFKVLL
jgi:hypothetical protein